MLDAEAVLGSEALLDATVGMGFSRPVAVAGLAAEVAAWSPAALEGLLAELDDEGRSRVPRRVLVIAARTLPASALRQCLLARALGAEVHLKCARGQEPLAEALSALDPWIVPTSFESGDPAAVARAVAGADCVVVLGNDDTVASVRAITPADKGFAGHGHRVSAVWLEDPGEPEIRGLAADVVAWDQAGCLAPQVAWVAGGPAAVRDVARHVAEVLSGLERELPLAAARVFRIARQRATPFVAMLGGELFAATTSAVMTLPNPSFRVSPGPRMLWVLPAELEALEATAPVLSTLACQGLPPIGPRAGLRTCAPGQMQRPALGWHQDGLHPLLSLLSDVTTAV